MSEIKTENTSQEKSGKKCKICEKLKPMRLYIIGFVCVFAICCLYAIFQMTNSSSVTITVNSASVSRGQNPDGSAFEIDQILNDEVLTAASAKLGGRISVAEMKRHLSVSDSLSEQTNQQLKQSIRDGEYENIYFPMVYQLTYETVSDKISQEGFGQQVLAVFESLAHPSKARILEAVAESYQDYYADSYLNYDAMFEINWEEIDAMDYYNRSEALRTETMRILRFLQDKTNGNPAAGASSVKLTYGDLSNDLWQLISVDIENHKAYIVQNSITTSRTELLRQFRYMEEIYNEEKERKTEEYKILDEAVEMYDSTTTKVVFIPALDSDDSFYMNRTKVGLDYLVESADAARLAADEAEHNAQYYQYLQTCFADAVTTDQSQISHADAVYLNIKEQIKDLMESVQYLLAETNQSENEGIKAGSANMTVGIVGVGLSFAKRFVILSMAAYVLICVYSVISSKKKKAEVQEV